MKKLLHIMSYAALLSLIVCGCNGIDSPEGDLKDIKLEDWPLTDCSTSTKPARDLVAYKLLGVPYKWEQDWLGGRVYVINPDLYSEKAPFSRLTCKLPWGGYPKSLHSLNMKNGRSDTPLS